MLNYRLTDRDIGAARIGVPPSPFGETYGEMMGRLDRAIADAATEKALRQVVAWLRTIAGPVGEVQSASYQLEALLESEVPHAQG